MTEFTLPRTTVFGPYTSTHSTLRYEVEQDVEYMFDWSVRVYRQDGTQEQQITFSGSNAEDSARAYKKLCEDADACR